MSSAHRLQSDLSEAGRLGLLKIEDPGAGGDIPANKTGIVRLVTAAAEARALADPVGEGLDLMLAFDEDGGDCTVTVASAFDPAGSTTLVFANAGEFALLRSVKVGTAYKWKQVAANLTLKLAADGLKVGGVIVDPYKIVTLNAPLNGDCVDQCFFQAERAYQVVGAYEIHATAGNDAGAVNMQITKDTGTDAPGAGTDLLTNNSNAGFNMKGTANTMQTATLTATTASLQLAAGNRLSVDFAGTVTTLAGVQLTVVLKAI